MQPGQTAWPDRLSIRSYDQISENCWSDQDAYEINLLYGCTEHNKHYFHTCDDNKIVFNHDRFGKELACNGLNDLCDGDGSDERNCHACGLGQHDCAENAKCEMRIGRGFHIWFMSYGPYDMAGVIQYGPYDMVHKIRNRSKLVWLRRFNNCIKYNA